MESELFKPDNFSGVDIQYKEFEGDNSFFNDILKLYFNDFKIKKIFQLDRPEINSQNFKIILFVNGKNREVLLRKYQVLSDLDQIIFYLNTLSFLKERGIKVSNVISNLAGQRAVKIRGGIYALFDFIEADYFSPAEESAVAVIEEIAKAHSALRSLGKEQISAIDNFSKRAAVYYNEVGSYSEKDFKDIENFIKNKESKNEDDVLVLDKMPLIRKTVIEVKEREKEISLLPKQIIHSDLHPHNVLMVNNEVGALIDFDAMRLSQRARDAAFAVYRFGRQFPVGSEESGAISEAPRLTKLFMDSYNKADKPACAMPAHAGGRLSEEEVRLMPILIKDEFLLKILFVLRGIYKKGNFSWAKDLRKFIAAIEEINYFWPNG